MSSDTVLQAPCAAGDHYACGYKNCSCTCHVKTSRGAWQKIVVVGICTLAVISILYVEVASKHSSKPVATAVEGDQVRAGLNDQGVRFAVSVAIDDFEIAIPAAGGSLFTQKEALTIAKIDLAVNTRTFESDYDANEIAADQKYKGKRFALTGTIKSINKDFTGGGYLTLVSGNLLGVQGRLNEHGMAGAETLRRGREITLVCRSSERVMDSEVASDCERLPQYLETLRPDFTVLVTDFLDGKRALPKKEAAAIAMMYLLGTRLPANSACLTLIDKSCNDEIEKLKGNQTFAAELKKDVLSLLLHLKSN